jgi:ABC-type antimicrobial peptide transport system permease subunit
MIAVGMQKTRLVAILFIEMIMLGIVGIITGIAGSIPIILYFKVNPVQLTGDYVEMMESYGMEPVMPFELESGFYIGQSLIVFVIFFIAILYPLYTVMQTKIIKALKA